MKNLRLEGLRVGVRHGLGDEARWREAVLVSTHVISVSPQNWVGWGQILDNGGGPLTAEAWAVICYLDDGTFASVTVDCLVDVATIPAANARAGADQREEGRP